MLKHNEIQLLNISDRVYKKFKRSTRGNENISIIDCRKKLTRNFILGTSMFKDGDYEQRYFGKLLMLVDLERMTVINIKNSKDRIGKVYINAREKYDLNNLLGLVGDR